jgi:hypothetical protein
MPNFVEALRAIDPALVTPISKEVAVGAEPISPIPSAEVGLEGRLKLSNAVKGVWMQPEMGELKALLSGIVHRSGAAAGYARAIMPYKAGISRGYKAVAKAKNLSGEFKSAWGTYVLK